MPITSLNFDLYPALIVLAATISSFFIGLPLGFVFLGKSSDSEARRFKLFYLSTIVGYSVINLLTFFGTLVNQTGTDSVACPAFLVLLAISFAFILVRREAIREIFGTVGTPLLLFVLALPFAATHILLPVVTGKWEMAYATGDDGARYYMLVNYLRANVFEYQKLTEETLRWVLRERPLHNVAGAILASISGSTSAVAYSVTAAISMVMAALSFCLVFESMFRITKKESRYILWGVAIFFFGFSGALINIYYTARGTHHFSVYPVLAGLGFLAVEDRGIRRLLWFVFWEVLLAYYYSFRFAINFLTLAGAMILLQWIAGEIRFRDLARNAAGMLVGLAAAFGAAYGELKVVIGAIPSQGLSVLTLQKSPGYGADGNGWDRLFKWSGFLGTYESYQNLPTMAKIATAGLILLMLVIAVVKAAKAYKKASAYTGLVAVSFLSGAWFLLTENYFVAWKSSLYWPVFAAIGLLAVSFEFTEQVIPHRRKIGLALLGLLLLYIGGTSRQLRPYISMVDDRYTKVDGLTNQMVDTLRHYLKSEKNSSTGKILGYDYSAERHLFLREMFREFDWQPIRGKELWFDYDLINKNAASFDEYKYDALLFASNSKFEPFDFSGNDSALFFDHYPFKLFGARSSFLEFRSGVEVKSFGYDAEKKCHMYRGQMQDDTCTFVFVNNGFHDWLSITLRCSNLDQLANENFMVSTNDSTVQFSLRLTNRGNQANEYEARFTGLAKNRLLRITAVQKNLKERPLIFLTKWGYAASR